jgi:uncharacterized protein
MVDTETTLSIPTKQTIIRIMKLKDVPPQVIRHEMAVSRKALKMAYAVVDHPVNLELVKIGALVHDIGRCVTHKLDHGIVGGEIIRELGFCDKLARIAECHVLAGITKEEAIEIGLPAKDYLPKTIEEKIVCLADKYFSGTEQVSIEERFLSWEMRWGKTNFLMAQRERALQLEREVLRYIYTDDQK